MVDIHSIIKTHRNKVDEGEIVNLDFDEPTTSEIPDVFFDNILVNFKLSRLETIVLMYLYRKVWCRSNMYQKHGISQLLSLTDMVKQLDFKIEEIHSAIRKLENFGFIVTIRIGQYFVRRYFTKDLDAQFGQTYDDFEV
ncbi:hypothetical protein [Bacteriovorax sp. Seq25_V]|uniref:hypothetical protein n=1 Tax=Bacteriovorax sp. Seq25_V TaxID=1201288 RepID=UPI00038A4750|nr:hypothetical protein [Bacteriovorax sp. Seq25_V]EQC48053.1 hypothetical protein M900_1122 [Bacteriovorax sp. Seq25_V]